ncbi:hypothetical protein QE152_g5757 [Popillia japonica]|uniref:RNA-directed DNA polymerase from mobile element jockey-like n=1 Tax=Popillia japonica TaxID=7064 RepID=A0AAW1MKY3_POPJA
MLSNLNKEKLTRHKNFNIAHYTDVDRYIRNITVTHKNINESWNSLLEEINTCILQYVPERTIKTSKSKPWISRALIKKINEKRKIWHRYKASNFEVDYHHYRTLCNTVTKDIRDAKAKYEHELVTSNSSKKFFGTSKVLYN